MLAGLLSAAQWTAIGTWTTAIILLATLIYAALQVREMRTLRREQVRPWIVVRFHLRSIIAFIAVENLGTTVARNVRLQFEPPLESTLGPRIRDAALLAEPIPNLAPGERRLALVERMPDRLESELPLRHKVMVLYQDHNGKELPAETFHLDFASYRNDIIPDKSIHDLATELEKVREVLVKNGR